MYDQATRLRVQLMKGIPASLVLPPHLADLVKTPSDDANDMMSMMGDDPANRIWPMRCARYM